jgi:hypothetical protein
MLTSKKVQLNMQCMMYLMNHTKYSSITRIHTGPLLMSSTILKKYHSKLQPYARQWTTNYLPDCRRATRSNYKKMAKINWVIYLDKQWALTSQIESSVRPLYPTMHTPVIHTIEQLGWRIKVWIINTLKHIAFSSVRGWIYSMIQQVWSNTKN